MVFLRSMTVDAYYFHCGNLQFFFDNNKLLQSQIFLHSDSQLLHITFTACEFYSYVRFKSSIFAAGQALTGGSDLQGLGLVRQ